MLYARELGLSGFEKRDDEKTPERTQHVLGSDSRLRRNMSNSTEIKIRVHSEDESAPPRGGDGLSNKRPKHCFNDMRLTNVMNIDER